MDREISALGLELDTPVRGDGSCLFRAIARCVFGEDAQWHVVKQQLYVHLGNNISTYQDYFAVSGEEEFGIKYSSPDLALDERVSEYVSLMLKSPGKMGGQLEVTLASEVFNSCFIIFSSSSGITKYPDHDVIPPGTFFLHHDRVHYSVLLPIANTLIRFPASLFSLRKVQCEWIHASL
jgi:hypothetical protein